MNSTPESIREAIDLSWCDYWSIFKAQAVIDYTDGPEILRYLSEMDAPVYRQLGFLECCKLQAYITIEA